MLKIGNIIDKKKGNYIYKFQRIDLGRHPITGKKICKDFYGKNKKELQEKVNNYISLINHQIDADSTETFGDFMFYWLKEVRFSNGLKNSSKERYIGLFENYIVNPEKFLTSKGKKINSLNKLFISNIPILKINTRCIQEYYNALFSSGVTSATILSINKLIKPCLKYAYTNNTLLKDYSVGLVIPGIKLERRRKKESLENPKNIFLINEQETFLNSIKGNREEVFYRLGFALGLRLGELLGLKWSRIDFKECTITIDTSVRREKDIETNISSLILTSLKTDSSYETLYAPQFIIDDLKKHKKLQDSEKELAGNLYSDNDLVFATEFGKIIEPSNIRKRYKKLLKKANIENKTLHSMRHTCATRLMEKRLTIKEIQYIMRHSDNSITGIYTHISDERKREIANLITL